MDEIFQRINGMHASVLGDVMLLLVNRNLLCLEKVLPTLVEDHKSPTSSKGGCVDLFLGFWNKLRVINCL